tara:strand:+ start:199 stop:603 length:405 start_codon:yes stop_codon:yes gene_type:complete
MSLQFQQQINEMTKKAIEEFESAVLKERTDENRLNAIGNIYFLFSNKELKYIGQRQSKGIKTRLNQHLFGKSYSINQEGKQDGTISKWNLVKKELDIGNHIHFKTIHIIPDNLRTTIELEMINKLKPEWNIQGK